MTLSASECAGGQCAMAHSMSGLRVRGITAASTNVTRPLRTSPTNCASVVLGTRPLKPPTGRNSRPVVKMGPLDSADVSLVTTLTEGATLDAARTSPAAAAAALAAPACSCSLSAAG